MRHLKSKATSIGELPVVAVLSEQLEHNPDKPRGFGDVPAVLCLGRSTAVNVPTRRTWFNRHESSSTTSLPR